MSRIPSWQMSKAAVVSLMATPSKGGGYKSDPQVFTRLPVDAWPVYTGKTSYALSNTSHQPGYLTGALPSPCCPISGPDVHHRPCLGIGSPIRSQLPCCHRNTLCPEITYWTCVPQRKDARTQRMQGALRHHKNRLFVQSLRPGDLALPSCLGLFPSCLGWQGKARLVRDRRNRPAPPGVAQASDFVFPAMVCYTEEQQQTLVLPRRLRPFIGRWGAVRSCSARPIIVRVWRALTFSCSQPGLAGYVDNGSLRRSTDHCTIPTSVSRGQKV